MSPHPIRVVLADDDLRRSRLTVFFRLPLFAPHLVWAALWGLAALVVAIIDWFATVILGTSPDWAHRFLASYLRYWVHILAFVLLAANPFPGFTGRPGSYPVDVEIDSPAHQYRWATGFRLILAYPAFALYTVLGAGSANNSTYSLGVQLIAAILGWWAALIQGRMPRGLRNVLVYSLGYGAQAHGYGLLLLTDRYPNSDPHALPAVAERREHPVELHVTDDTRRWQVHIAFRFFTAIPHLLWLGLWAWWVVPLFAFFNWIVTLVQGRSVPFFHDFFSFFLRYSTHVFAYVLILAEPFPGFLGRPGSYPIEVAVPALATQNRWRTGFRIILAIPALLLASAMTSVLFTVATLGYFAALFTARMPVGLRNLGVSALRYTQQTLAYGVYLITDAYPYSGPAAGPPPPPPAPPRDWPRDWPRGEPVPGRPPAPPPSASSAQS
jgi:hypothetical protein